jgi:hypothetical protein
MREFKDNYQYRKYNAKLDKLTGSITDLVQQKETLETSITDDISIEEAEAIRARVEGSEVRE